MTRLDVLDQYLLAQYRLRLKKMGLASLADKAQAPVPEDNSDRRSASHRRSSSDKSS
jgi:hypothetical protein